MMVGDRLRLFRLCRHGGFNDSRHRRLGLGLPMKRGRDRLVMGLVVIIFVVVMVVMAMIVMPGVVMRVVVVPVSVDLMTILVMMDRLVVGALVIAVFVIAVFTIAVFMGQAVLRMILLGKTCRLGRAGVRVLD